MKFVMDGISVTSNIVVGITKKSDPGSSTLTFPEMPKAPRSGSDLLFMLEIP
jgi:hypothetical protein